jgi:hypothetical protein
MDWGRPQLAEQFGTAQIPFPPETISVWILLKGLIYWLRGFVLRKLTISISFLMPLAYHPPIWKMLKFKYYVILILITFFFNCSKRRSLEMLCNIRYSNFGISKIAGWHAKVTTA